MKNNILVKTALILLATLACCGSRDNVAEKKIWVRGNCEMCQDRIESHVKKINGVKAANWNVDSKELTVSYDSTLTNQDAIESICAQVGHATKKKVSEGKVIDELPECCRPE